MSTKIGQFVWVGCIIVIVNLMAFGHSFAEEELAAKVGSVPITRLELESKFRRALPLQGNFHGGVSEETKAEILQGALDELIEQAYKIQFAIDEEISVKNSAVEQKMAEIVAQYPSVEEYRQALGADEAKLRASIYRSLLANKAEDIRVRSKVVVTEDEVKQFYSENKSRYMRPRQFRASHILVKVDPASNKQERKELLARAQGLLKRAKDGEGFYNLAYYNSDDPSKFVGGDLGVFHEGQTVESFEKALLKLKPGEVSDLVKTRFGYHIIKLVELHEPRQLTYDEMASKIRSQIEKEKYSAIYDVWIADLRSKYLVEKY